MQTNYCNLASGHENSLDVKTQVQSWNIKNVLPTFQREDQIKAYLAIG